MTIDLTMERWLPAPPDRVFDAFTDIDRLRSWYSCDPTSTWTFHTWEAEVGGSLRVTISGAGYRVEVSGTFLAVERPNRLAYDWGDELIELAFRPDNGGTLVQLRHTRLATETDRQIRDGGWTNNLASLTTHLTEELG